MDGQGQFKWPDKSSYKGTYINGIKEGHGKFTYSDGVVYEGQWKADKKHGQGTMTWSDPDGKKNSTKKQYKG